MTQIRATELANLDKIWHLRQTKLVDGLDEEDLAAVATTCKDRIYSKGETIFERGESAAHIYVLFRGCVRSSIGSLTGSARPWVMKPRGSPMTSSSRQSLRLPGARFVAIDARAGQLSLLEHALILVRHDLDEPRRAALPIRQDPMRDGG